MTDTDLISERGHFWLTGEASSFTPETATRGTVTVDRYGTAMLAVDPGEWKWGSNFDFDELQDQKFDICAFMPGTNKYLHIRGGSVMDIAELSTGWRANKVRSHFSLLSRSNILATSEKVVSSLRIPIENLWPWLGFGNASINEIEGHVEVRIPLHPDQHFRVGDDSVFVSIERPEPGDLSRSTLCIEQKAWLEYRWNVATTLNQAQELYRHLEELFIFLTDHECSLIWPRIKLSDGSLVEQLFLTRLRREDCEVSEPQCWTVLSQLSLHFGEILRKWFAFQERYRASLSLFLSLRREKDLYVVHEFVTILWAFESLHKHSLVDSSINTSLWNSKPKLGDSIKKLQSGERIKHLLCSLPLSFDIDSLERFCKRCVDARNKISHGDVDDAEARPFEVKYLFLALKALYQVLILHRIGVPNEALKSSIYRRPKGSQLPRVLKRAGLTILGI